jgi:hypothetical protein
MEHSSIEKEISLPQGCLLQRPDVILLFVLLVMMARSMYCAKITRLEAGCRVATFVEFMTPRRRIPNGSAETASEQRKISLLYVYSRK